MLWRHLFFDRCNGWSSDSSIHLEIIYYPAALDIASLFLKWNVAMLMLQFHLAKHNNDIVMQTLIDFEKLSGFALFSTDLVLFFSCSQFNWNDYLLRNNIQYSRVIQLVVAAELVCIASDKIFIIGHFMQLEMRLYFHSYILFI